MTAYPIKFLQLAEQLQLLSQKRASGQLILGHAGGQGRLLLLSGRLLYAKSAVHPVRRWSRAVQQACPQWQITTPTIEHPTLWEIDLLSQGIVQKKINVTSAKSVLRIVTKEVFFDLGGSEDLKLQWIPGQIEHQDAFLSLALSYLEVEPILNRSEQLQRQWQAIGLGKLTPTLSPLATQTFSPEALSGLGKYLTGQFSLWDIALFFNTSVDSIARALIPLVKKKLLVFRKIPDLGLPFHIPVSSPPQTVASHSISGEVASPPVVAVTPPGEPILIACIDDSPLIAQTLREILEPAGYRILAIQEPMRGFAQLLEQKPALIFLDLIMPNASGYDVCKFLRKTSAFEQTPVIVLTSRDTLIDRNRAKLAGANDFLGKPPSPEKTLKMVHKYLRPSSEDEPQNRQNILFTDISDLLH